MNEKKIDLEKLNFTGVTLSFHEVEVFYYNYPDLDDSYIVEFKFGKAYTPFPNRNLNGEYLCGNKDFPKILGNAITFNNKRRVFFLVPAKDFLHGCILVKKIAKYLTSYSEENNHFKGEWNKWCDKMEKDSTKTPLIPGEALGKHSIPIETEAPIPLKPSETSNDNSDIYEKESIIQDRMDRIRKVIKKDLRKRAKEIASLIAKTSNTYYFESEFTEELKKELEKVRKNKK